MKMFLWISSVIQDILKVFLLSDRIFLLECAREGFSNIYHIIRADEESLVKIEVDGKQSNGYSKRLLLYALNCI